jgi:hypothetical protein
MGPFPHPSMSRAKYVLTFIDDWSRYTWVYFLKKKYEVFEYLKDFKALAEKQSGKGIKILHTNNKGGVCEQICPTSMCRSRYCVIAFTSPNPCRHLHLYQILHREEVHRVTSSLGSEGDIYFREGFLVYSTLSSFFFFLGGGGFSSHWVFPLSSLFGDIFCTWVPNMASYCQDPKKNHASYSPKLGLRGVLVYMHHFPSHA